jgi:D-alanyl-D-alanine carboxypeptidase/D-alanyl-D-alanine-endopeptidase (penicillin-binding protein 4)
MKSLISNYKFLVLLTFVILNFCPVQAKMTKPKTSAAPPDLKEILNKYKISPADISLQILKDDKVILSHDSEAKKIPASVSKLLTSYAILKRLPPGHRFYTRLYFDGKNIYLKGGGDPSFVSENMWFLVNEMSRGSLKSIRGDIIVDDSLFDDIRYDQSREPTRVDRAYDAPVGAMSFNWNSVNVFVSPTEISKKARVIVDPQSGYFDLINNATTVSYNPKSELSVNVSNSQRIITVSGEVKETAVEKAIFKNVETPDIWAGVNLKFFLAQRGISVGGVVRNGITPANSELIASYESKSLAHILGDMNKFSNNFVAEMLTKSLAVEEGKRASLKRGVEIIREELKKIDLDERRVVIANPSGLTRDNSFSAASLNKVLIEIKNDFSIFPTFVDSLPIAGIDGTLKRRLKGTEAEGWIRAKTGYLTDVVSLSGYAGRRDGQLLTFTFLYNGPRDEGIVREAFDQILLSRLK